MFVIIVLFINFTYQTMYQIIYRAVAPDTVFTVAFL